jgi:hypothetical protein
MIVPLAALALSMAPALLAAESPPKPIEACVPADPMLVYFNRPAAETREAQPTGPAAQLAAWMITLKAMGIIPQQGRMLADIVGTLPLLARRPHAIVLLEATPKVIGPRSYRLGTLSSALIVESSGLEIEFDRRIRDLLSTYADAENGRIERQRIGNVEFHRLIDQRLPAWAVMDWGTVGEYLVVAVGKGTFERVLAAMEGQAASLAADRWYAHAHRRCGATGSGLEIYADFTRLRERVDDVMNDEIRSALEAAQLDKVDRALMAVGFDGRALHSEALARDLDGKDHHLLLTGKEVAAPEVLAAIPEGADCFAAFRMPLGLNIRRARQAYMETQSPSRQQRWRDLWNRLQAEFDFDVETGLLDALGDHVIFHTYPPHPLRLAMLGTVWIQIKPEDTAIVQRTVDRIMAGCAHYINRPAASRPAITRFSFWPEIRRDAAGLWYLQLGVIGPAVGVSEGWIVISFSPEAVRQNLAHLERG